MKSVDCCSKKIVEKSNRKRFELIRYFLSFGLSFRVVASISMYESRFLECLTMLLLFFF